MKYIQNTMYHFLRLSALIIFESYYLNIMAIDYTILASRDYLPLIFNIFMYFHFISYLLFPYFFQTLELLYFSINTMEIYFVDLAGHIY